MLSMCPAELAARVISVSSAQVMLTYKFFITLDSLLEVLVISYGKVKPGRLLIVVSVI